MADSGDRPGKPHRVRGWLTRPADPHFFTKAADVCALYRSCPPRSVVLSVDEKTAMADRSRKHPDWLPGPGRVCRREFGYVRHGNVSVTAALDVHTWLASTIVHNETARPFRWNYEGRPRQTEGESAAAVKEPCHAC